MTETIFLTIVFTLEFLLFYFLPTLNGQKTLFGIVLKDDDFQTHGRPILRKYRRDLWIIGLAGLCAIFLLGGNFPDSLPVAYIFISLIIIYPLFKYLRETWRLRDKRTVSRLATPLNPRRLKDFTNLWVELFVIATTIAPFVILANYYARLPDVIPIHWNLSGEPDGWARKDFFSVFFLPCLTAFMQVFFIILKQDIIGARFRVPAEQAEKILSLKGISLQANVGMIDWCRLMVGILLGTVGLLIISPVVPTSFADVLNVSIWANLVVLLSGMAFYIYRMILANREIKALTGQITFQTAAEMQGWADGLFYYNSQDSAFMVEKPGGMGYTINFAHRRAMLYAALMFMPILLSILSAILIASK